jgi:hypothetical protein
MIVVVVVVIGMVISTAAAVVDRVVVVVVVVVRGGVVGREEGSNAEVDADDDDDTATGGGGGFQSTDGSVVLDFTVVTGLAKVDPLRCVVTHQGCCGCNDVIGRMIWKACPVPILPVVPPMYSLL